MTDHCADELIQSEGHVQSESTLRGVPMACHEGINQLMEKILEYLARNRD